VLLGAASAFRQASSFALAPLVEEEPVREFYLYAIKKDGDDLCAIKKVARTCVPSS
jgi:hypothetical protein